MTKGNQINVYLYRAKQVHQHNSDLFKRFLLVKEAGLTDVQFQYGPYGKPFVHVPDVYFNISHSGQYLAGAVSTCSFIGIDIERIKPIDFDCIDFFMSEKEIAHFKEIQLLEEKLDYFYKIWTLKEAYAKMLGMGLHMKLTDISLDNQQIKSTFKDVFCHSIMVDNLYRLSLICSQEMNINIVRITEDMIIQKLKHNQFI